MIAASARLTAADPRYDSAARKLDLIQSGRAPRGSAIVLSPEEINAWVRVAVPETVPDGVRQPRVDLGDESATGFALIDFLKLRQAKGSATNWLIARLIDGERPVEATAQVSASGGRCTVHVTRVAISSAEVSGTTLDLLIHTFLLPLFPDAKIDEPFELDYNIDRIDIRKTGVTVTIKK